MELDTDSAKMATKWDSRPVLQALGAWFMKRGTLYDVAYQDRQAKSLAKKAAQLDYRLVIESAAL